MFITWSIVEAWSWFVNLPYLGGLVLLLPFIVMLLAVIAEDMQKSR